MGKVILSGKIKLPALQAANKAKKKKKKIIHDDLLKLQISSTQKEIKDPLMDYIIQKCYVK